MIRSSEFKRATGVHVGKPVLDHMRVKPHSQGVTVQHFHEGKHGVQATHEFGKGEHEAFMDHMDTHAGMAMGAGEPEADSSKAVGGLEEE